MENGLTAAILQGIFVLVGTVGSILSIITVVNKHCKKSSYTVYLAALAVADLLALYAILMPDSYKIGNFSFDLKTTSAVLCKLHWFFPCLFTLVSTWLIVILALERTFVVYFPFKAKSVCKPKYAGVVTTLLVIFLTAFNAHYIYGMQLQPVVSSSNDTTNLNISGNFSINETTTLSPFIATDVDKINNNDDGKNDVKDDTNSVNKRTTSGGDITKKSLTTTSPERDTTHHGQTAFTNANHTQPVSTPDCRPSLNQTGDCVPIECTVGLLDAVAICDPSKSNITGSDVETLMPNACNISPFLDNTTAPLQSDVSKDNCTSINQNWKNALIESRDTNHSKSTQKPHNQGNATLTTNICGFVDQNYVNFYRSFAMFESLLYYWLPVIIIITANTATWLKVRMQSRESLTSMAAMALRRTRHVLILTTLISVAFVVFTIPLTVVYLLDVLLTDDLKYPLYNDNTWTVLTIAAGLLYLGNHCCNFFLYIMSGERFRNSLKAALCKPTSSQQDNIA